MVTFACIVLVAAAVFGALLSMDAIQFHKGSDGMKLFLGLLALLCMVITVFAAGGWVAVFTAGVSGFLAGTIFGSAMGR